MLLNVYSLTVCIHIRLKVLKNLYNELFQPNISSNRHWAGIISCHTDEGWFPAASFVDSRGECDLGDHINATDIENLKFEISHVNSKYARKLVNFLNKLTKTKQLYQT